ncbi:MAG TPA: cytochrome P460 family protein, partial [Pyrinomonadaceae bacterium]
MRFGTTPRLLLVLAFLTFGALCALVTPDGPRGASAAATQGASGQQQCARLPVPSAVGVAEFERRLITFLKGRCYEKWVADREVRDTGPFVGGVYYGTHPAVKVFYSPEMWDWLKKRNRRGDAPDGAVVVKEQFTPPAAEDSPLTGWSVMVRDAKGSWDGWYWSGHSVDPRYDPQMAEFDPLKIDYKGQGFGTYCLRCHASAVEKSSTFSTARNVEDDPISYAVQVPTFNLPPANTQLTQPLAAHDAGQKTARSPHDDAHPTLPSPDAVQTAAEKPAAFPSENFDHVYPGAGGPPQFVTSDQCVGCHTASDVNMSALFMTPPVNLSPYTEWRSSMMGLAGRDPVFHAQVESERGQFADSPLGDKDDFLDTTCFHCHGVMGQRQLVIDNLKPGQPVPPGGGTSPAFRHEYVYAMPGDPQEKYGALARDG